MFKDISFSPYIALLLPMIATIIAILWDYEHKPKKLVIFLCAVCIVGTTAALVDRYSNDSAQIILEKNIKSLKTKYDSLHDETLKNVIGVGYSLFTLTSGSKENEYFGVLINDNKYPSYGIQMDVSLAEDLKKCKSETKDGNFYIDRLCYDRNVKALTVDEVYPNTSMVVNYRILSNEAYQKFEIRYFSKSSLIVQQVVVKLGKGICAFSSRIYDLSSEQFNTQGSNKLIKQYDGIPGLQIDWDKEFLPIKNRFAKTY